MKSFKQFATERQLNKEETKKAFEKAGVEFTEVSVFRGFHGTSLVFHKKYLSKVDKIVKYGVQKHSPTEYSVTFY